MSSPSYTTAPSTPKSSTVDDSFTGVEFGESFSTVPFHWENKPGLPKPSFPSNDDDNDDGFTFHTTYNNVKEDVYTQDHIKTKRTLKPPPPMPLRDSSFGRKGVVKRTVWRGRRSCSCEFNVEFDPFEAALEKVVKENDETTQLTGDHRDNKRGVKKLLNFPRISFSDHKSGYRSTGSSFSSTYSSGCSSSDSLPCGVEPKEAQSDRGSTSKLVKIRAYKYNKWIVGCLGFHKEKVVKDFVALSL